MLALDGQRVLVLGLGVSGRSAAAFCAARGAEVVAYDARAETSADGLPPGVAVQRGGPAPDAACFDLVVPSPGVAPAQYAARARAHRLPIWGDIELAFRALDVPVVAVTGTNGKSTTVKLVEAMLCAGGLRARAAGNLGAPALELVGAALDVAVLEVSSFQLESVEAFRPRVAVLLNCTPDHLDRHGDFERYRAAKLNIFARQRARDVAIVNGDDDALVAASERLHATRWSFRTARQTPAPTFRGAQLAADAVCLNTDGNARRVALSPGARRADVPSENLLAALLCAHALGVAPETALGALANFEALPHRMQLVSECDGVRWVNDSKATNPDAACAALRALQSTPGRVWWIAGGRDKGVGFAALRAAPLARVARLFAIGESADALARELGEQLIVEPSGTLKAACARARALAARGDTILLSPACASFDQFENFEARGDHFTQLAQGARGSASSSTSARAQSEPNTARAPDTTRAQDDASAPTTPARGDANTPANAPARVGDAR